MIITYNSTSGIKRVSSLDYNYCFSTKTGTFVRWGRNLQDDPKVGHLEIFDLEVSEECNGIPAIGSTIAVPCTFCFKLSFCLLFD